jgi:hypothetical protein
VYFTLEAKTEHTLQEKEAFDVILFNYWLTVFQKFSTFLFIQAGGLCRAPTSRTQQSAYTETEVLDIFDKPYCPSEGTHHLLSMLDVGNMSLESNYNSASALARWTEVWTVIGTNPIRDGYLLLAVVGYELLLLLLLPITVAAWSKV